MSKLSPIVPEFEAAEEAASYDTWFRTKVEEALASKEASVPHDRVMAEVRSFGGDQGETNGCALIGGRKPGATFSRFRISFPTGTCGRQRT